MCVCVCARVCLCVCLYLSICPGLIIATWSDVIKVWCAWCFAELPSLVCLVFHRAAELQLGSSMLQASTSMIISVKHVGCSMYSF